MACAISCDDPDDKQPATYTVITVSAVGLAGIVLGLVLCFRDGDCRD